MRILLLLFFIQIFSPSLHAQDCVWERKSSLSAFERFTGSFDEILKAPNLHSKQGFAYIAKGVSAHESCFRNMGKDYFDKQVKAALKQGLSCLQNVAQNSAQNSAQSGPQKKDAKVFTLIDRFTKHFEDSGEGAKITCDESAGAWEHVNAYASHSPQEEAFGKHQLRHPYILLNPKFKKGFGSLSKGDESFEEREFQGIVFHELIHNMGFSHGEGQDLAYACEACCFGESGASACRLCEGGFKGARDPEYVYELAKLETALGISPYLELIHNKKDPVIWSDRTLSSLLEFYSRENPEFAKAINSAIRERFEDQGLKKTWDQKLGSSIKGGAAIKEYYDSLARFFVKAVVDKNEQEAIKAFKKIDFKSLESQYGSGTMAGMRNRKIDKALYEARQLSRDINQAGDFIFLRLGMQNVLGK